jgi:hypothetical protein
VPLIGVQNSAARGDMGAATGAVTLSRMAGASIAISVYGATIAGGLSRGRTAIPGVEDIEILTPTMLAALPEAARQLVAEAYAGAFQPLFLIAAGITLVTLIAALSLKPVRLPPKATG